MIRDSQGDDVEVYITDDIEKRILISNYHPIFKLEVSQLEEAIVEVEQPIEENKITIITDKIIEVNTEQTIAIQVEGFGGTKYRKQGSSYIKLNSPIWGYYYNDDFFSDYKYVNSILTENNSNKTLFIDADTQDQYIIIDNKPVEVTDIIPGQLEDDGSFTPFFKNYDNYPKTTTTIDSTENTDTTNLVNDYLDANATLKNTDIFITYDNLIQLKIKTGVNKKTIHTVQFPHLITGTVFHKCIFTTPGLYTLEVSVIDNSEEIKKQSFNIDVVDNDEIREIISIDNGETIENDETLYVPNKIGNRIINPHINQPTNLKFSLNALILDNNYIKDLLNSNRSNVIFTSPTNKDYQVYKYESHNIYDDDQELIDTWFYINADYIDEYVELHILPIYINAMDNIILLSDNDVVDYFTPLPDPTIITTPLSFAEEDEEDEEYEVIIDEGITYYRTKTPVCSDPKWLIPIYDNDLENYTISFDCYSSYYYLSVFYIGDFRIYGADNKVYLKYLDDKDIFSYDLLKKGVHNIEFSVIDDKITLGIDEYIVSSNLFGIMQPPSLSDIRIGFQQVKRDKFTTEVLATDDPDGLTYISNAYLTEYSESSDQIPDVSTYNFKPDQKGVYKLDFDDANIKNLSRLEIDIIRRGTGSNIIGIIDKTNHTEEDSYDETTLLDYHETQESSHKNTHYPIQYNNNDSIGGYFVKNNKHTTVTLNIESINPLKKITQDGNFIQYNYPNNSENVIIQTLKYFNDDLYNESYNQSTQTLSDALTLITNEQYYNQHWRDKGEDGVYEYYEVTFDD